MQQKSSWQPSKFLEQEADPLAGFANIMDVMLVFSLGLMLALVAQSPELQKKLNITSSAQNQIEISAGDELVETPESIDKALNGQASGMESLGQVFRDPKTGKLILISKENGSESIGSE